MRVLVQRWRIWRTPPQMGAHLDTRRGLAGAQHDRDGTRALGVVDMDRQEAALVVMGVEERELLMPVHDIAGVVDVENDSRGFAFIGGQPLIDERPCQPDRVLQRRRVLQPRQRRLRTQVRARVRQPPASELEGRINAQSVEIVGIFISAGNRQDAGADHVRQRVRDPQRVAAIGKAPRQSFRDPQPTVRHREQHDAAIRGQSAAIESRSDRLSANGWK